MKDVIDKLRSMDKKELGEAVKAAKAFIGTDEGQALINKIKEGGEISGSAQSPESIKKELEKNPHIAKTIFDILNGKG